MTKKRSLDGDSDKSDKIDKIDKIDKSGSQSESQEKIKKIKKKPKHEKEQVQSGSGGIKILPPILWGQRSNIPPEKVELLHKYFDLREIKAFAELYNALLLSKSSKNITRKMVKDKMQNIQQVEFKNVRIHNHTHHMYAVNVTGISSDDVLHFLYWKYGCVPPDGIEIHDALYSNFSLQDKLDQDPNKVKHNIFISPTWLTDLEDASRYLFFKFVDQQVLPFLGPLNQDDFGNIRQFLHGSRKTKSMKDVLIEKYHWKSEKPEQKYFSLRHLLRARAAQTNTKSTHMQSGSSGKG